MSTVAFTVKDGDAVSFPKSSENHSKKGEYVGMVQKRHTTDLLFFLLIFGMWVAMSVVGGIAVRYVINTMKLPAGSK